MLQILGKVSEYFYPYKRFASFFVFLRENYDAYGEKRSIQRS